MEYRIWWIPNPPRESFRKEYPTAQQALDAVDLLADYDLYLDSIKTDLIHSNAGGVEVQTESGDWEEFEDAG